jgi:hypothetical protein
MYKSPVAFDTYSFKGYFGNDGAPYINVKVKPSQKNNSYIVPFRIDTGKSASSFSPQTAKALDINDKTSIMLTFGDKEPPITLPSIKGFQITPEYTPNTLGTDVLFRFFELNLDKNTVALTYLNEQNTGVTGQKYMHIDVKIPELDVVKRLKFGIDTGASESSFSHKDAKSLGIYDRAQINPKKYYGFEGDFNTKISTTPMEFCFAENIKQPHTIPLNSILITENNFPTIIGTDILLSHFNLHIKKNIIELTVLT